MVTDAMTTNLSGVLQPDISEKILGAFGPVRGRADLRRRIAQDLPAAGMA